jgi:predicted ATPase
MREGLVEPEDEAGERLRFAYVPLREAVYAAVAARTRARRHLAIARAMLSVWDEPTRQARAHELADQLIGARPLLRQEGMAPEAARWCTAAGEAALAGTAFEAAAGYAHRALSLLPRDVWQSEPALAGRVHILGVRAERCVDNVAASERLTKVLLARSPLPAHRAIATILLVDEYTVQGRLRAVRRLARRQLRNFGVEFPRRVRRVDVVNLMAAVQASLTGRSAEELPVAHAEPNAAQCRMDSGPDVRPA